MSENFPGGTFAYQKITPSEDAAVRRATLGDGILTGCALSYSGSTLTMGAGSLFLCGRVVRHPLAQHWPVVGAASGYARLLLTVDISRTATSEEFDQVVDTLEYADTADGFPPLVQENINAGGTVYQMVVCVVSLNGSGISGIEQTAEILDRLKSYAPAGFGLGQETPPVITSLAELDALTQCGWYRLDIQSDAASISNVNVSRATVFVEGYDGANVIQTISIPGTTTRVIRSRKNGVWQPFGVENPPLTMGKEYRTTEYWGGKPVFIQRMAFYADVFSEEILSLAHDIEGMDVCIFADVLWKRTDKTPDGWRHLPASFYGDSTWDGQVDYVSDKYINFRLGWNLMTVMQQSTEYVYVTLKYTKK